MCAADLITSWAFKIELMNVMAPRCIANAIPGFSRFPRRAIKKNFGLVKATSKAV